MTEPASQVPASHHVAMTQPALARGRSIRLPFRLWLLIFAGCAVAGFLGAFQSAVQNFLFAEDRHVRWGEMAFQAGEWLFLAPLTLLTFTLGQSYPVRKPRLGRALLIHSCAALVLCVAWAGMGVVLRRSLGMGWEMPLSMELIGWTLFSLPWSFFMYFAVLGTVHAFGYYFDAKEQQLRSSRLQTQAAEARLRTLSAQLNPHFLFNTLNTISVLVRDGKRDLATGVVDRLSDLLRQLLRAEGTPEITLAEELELLGEYLEIESLRFSDRLQITYEIGPDVRSAFVPSLILQPLVENSLRHGLARTTHEFRLEVGAERSGNTLRIWVRDDGPGLPPTFSRGIGLSNTIERLRTLYAEPASFELVGPPGGGAINEIRLPFANTKRLSSR